ncbi:MAG: UDP-GlcNAc:undecaprenyl-phosphate GlcNAc-1-phosphate transferase [Cryomorphaceae bacterium]|jgi:UDP-GlcNAc:undecaprenyl-phosphate GlcNAc-1-phosphate transferase
MKESLQYIIYYIFFFLAMTALALLINSILLRFVKTLGTKNQEGVTVRWSSQTKPAIGGLSFFILFLISLCLCLFFYDYKDVVSEPQIPGLLLSAGLGFLMGLTDDAYNTRPLLKLSIQILCGVILVVTGSAIALFESDWMNYTLTVFWIVGIMNSINMLDNMDGIAASVGSFILAAPIVFMISTETYGDVNFMLIVGVLASLVAFLYHNWYPSKMFMGDTGSQFLGVILGYVGIHYCWNVGLEHDPSQGWYSLVALLTVFILPISDTLTVTINRLRRGQSPFVGGKDHTTHHLSYRGFSDSQVAKIFVFISAFSVLLYTLYLINIDPSDYVMIGMYLFYFLAVFFILYILTEVNKKKGIKDH